MSRLLLSKEGYKSVLTVRETENAIKQIKDYFELELAKALNLQRVSAPLFVRPESGLNDNLNGVERPVSFEIKDIFSSVEIVHSLAKWKRLALKQYDFKVGEGLYTDMNAIRRDEDLDNLHSVYVDQWDWEKVIDKDQRNIDTLKSTVLSIVQAIKKTEDYICSLYPQLNSFINDDVFFITTQQLEDMYPDLTPKERESAICKEKGTVFIMQIGDKLKSGQRHDGRAPDYDDWKLNGDILFWYEPLNMAFEISSMGIRVDEEALEYQLKQANCLERRNLPFHKALLEGKLPYTIGGGIGQSRLCMILLEKVHIGEVQSSVWPEDMIIECNNKGIHLL